VVRKSERNTSFSKCGRRWDDDYKTVLKSMGLEEVDWIYLAQDRDKWRTFMNVKFID